MASVKRAAAAAASRAKVLTSAKVLFERYGYDAVTMRQIARDIGMSTGVLFSHFAGKADLFEAATGHPAPDVPAFLERVSQFALDAAVDSPRFVELQDLATAAVRLRHHLIGHHG